MIRAIVIYGALAGAIVIGVMMLGMTMVLDGYETGLAQHLLGYLIMIIALSLIFVAVKRHRDRVLGGVIKFWPALGMGLAISAVAGVVYVVVWEIYLAATDYAFIGQYAAVQIDARRAAGASEAELQEFAASMQALAESYENPLFRTGITFLEIFPVGALVSLVSAGLLRNPKLLPARRG